MWQTASLSLLINDITKDMIRGPNIKFSKVQKRQCSQTAQGYLRDRVLDFERQHRERRRMRFLDRETA